MGPWWQHRLVEWGVERWGLALCLVVLSRLEPAPTEQVSLALVGASLSLWVEALLQVSCCCSLGDYLVRVG